MTAPHLDTTVGIETPEGVSLTLSPAGPVPRALAWAIDQLLRVAVYFAASMVLLPMKSTGQGLLLLLVFLLEWFYPVLFEVLARGATPGKAALDIAVVELDGRPVSWSSSTVRNFLRTVDFLPLLYCAGLISMLFTRRFQRLGDLAAGTLVIHRGNRAARRTQAIAVTPFSPTVALAPEEQHALLALAGRHTRLSPERIAELAAIAPALTGNTPALQAERLLGIARYLTGEREDTNVRISVPVSAKIPARGFPAVASAPQAPPA